jgi:hypothetical protein
MESVINLYIGHFGLIGVLATAQFCTVGGCVSFWISAGHPHDQVIEVILARCGRSRRAPQVGASDVVHHKRTTVELGMSFMSLCGLPSTTQTGSPNHREACPSGAVSGSSPLAVLLTRPSVVLPNSIRLGAILMRLSLIPSVCPSIGYPHKREAGL